MLQKCFLYMYTVTSGSGKRNAFGWCPRNDTSATHHEQARESPDDAGLWSGTHGGHGCPIENHGGVAVNRNRGGHWRVPCGCVPDYGRREKHRTGRGLLDQLDNQQHENRQAPLERRVLDHDSDIGCGKRHIVRDDSFQISGVNGGAHTANRAAVCYIYSERRYFFKNGKAGSFY